MTTLYRCRFAPSELAELFGAEASGRLDLRPTVWPGGTGLVIRADGGRRVAEPMRWGLPMARVDWKATQKPDATLLFSRHLVDAEVQGLGAQRCLIVLDSFAYPDGEAGRRIRTWFAMWDEPLFAWAGLCGGGNDGPRFAGLAATANPLVERVSPHMPAIIAPENYSVWLDGPLEEAFPLICPFDQAKMVMEPTDELWTSEESLEEL